MSATTLIEHLARIDFANALLAERRRDVEHRSHLRRGLRGAASGDVLGRSQGFADSWQAADCDDSEDVWPAAFGALTDVADAFLDGDAQERAALASTFGAATALADGHRAYLVRAAAELGASRDAIWLRRSVAVVALARGGDDCNAEQVALDGLVAAARACGVDPVAEFRDVARLASATTPFGQGRSSVREFLFSFVQ